MVKSGLSLWGEKRLLSIASVCVAMAHFLFSVTSIAVNITP